MNVNTNTNIQTITALNLDHLQNKRNTLILQMRLALQNNDIPLYLSTRKQWRQTEHQIYQIITDYK